MKISALWSTIKSSMSLAFVGGILLKIDSPHAVPIVDKDILLYSENSRTYKEKKNLE